MSDNKGNGKSPTAQDLLTRLKKPKGADTEMQTDNPGNTYKDFIAKRENRKKDSFSIDDSEIVAAAAPEEVEEIVYDDSAFEAAYNEAYAEAEGDSLEIEDIDAAFGPEEALEYAENVYAEEVFEYADEISDEYGEYIDETALDTDEVAEYITDYTEEEISKALDETEFPIQAYEAEEYAPAYAEEYYEDVIPDDDFFDNDPIEELEEPEYVEYESEPEEYDEEKDFEHLVAEVTGGASVDEIDETDISLMVALGMEDELAKTVGEETASQITDDFVADQEEWVDRTNRFGADEYTDASQNREIADKYRKRRCVAFWGMLASMVFCAVLFIFENITVITQFVTGTKYYFAGAFDAEVYPIVYIMADLQLLLLCAVPVLGRIANGLKDLAKFRYSVDCLPALLTVVAVVNTVVMATTTSPGVAPVLFNFVVALCLVFTAINEFMTVRREIFSFNIISSRKPKFVMRRLSVRDSVLESEAVADMDAEGADEGDIIKIQKTDFVDGYFWRTKNKGTISRAVVGLATVISVALAVVVMIYAFVVRANDPLNVGFAVLSASVPASMVVVGFYPFYRANRRAYDNDSTIIGEGSVEEYSGVGVISFDDVNVFPSYSVKVRNVRLFNNSRIDKVLYYAASVFSATGGPLADVFEVATMETGHSDNVTILETGTGYIEAEVNGRSIMFGRAPALATRGILIPDDIVAESMELPNDCSVMYMIYQRKLVAKMIVNYVLDPDFEYVLRQLTGSGMCVCVKTFDPNIDEEMILRQLPQTSYAMRVIKYKNTEEITKYSKSAEGGIVSRDNTKSLLHTVASCDKILSAQKTGFVIGVISAILNAVIVAVVLMAGSFSALCSLYLVLCQLFWLVPVVISTRLIVR